MEMHLDASIDKLDNLDMTVQFDKEKRMEHTKDKEQKAPDTEREVIYSPMVAEPQEYKYVKISTLMIILRLWIVFFLLSVSI